MVLFPADSCGGELADGFTGAFFLIEVQDVGLERESMAVADDHKRCRTGDMHRRPGTVVDDSGIYFILSL